MFHDNDDKQTNNQNSKPADGIRSVGVLHENDSETRFAAVLVLVSGLTVCRLGCNASIAEQMPTDFSLFTLASLPLLR